MKYIRTDYGIYEITDYKIIKNGTLYFVMDGVITNHLGKVISQADTIDELIDCLTIKDLDSSYDLPYTANKSLLDEYYRKLEPFGGYAKSKYKVEVYACIWIFDADGSPTLKPVAKLNKEGKLELL